MILVRLLFFNFFGCGPDKTNTLLKLDKFEIKWNFTNLYKSIGTGVFTDNYKAR